MKRKKPIRSPWKYILNRDHTDYADSTVVGLTGPKRSCKTLEFAKLLFWDLCLGRPVWSNLPVYTPKYFLDKGWPRLETMPIDWDAFFTMSEEYQDGTMGIDEASYYNSNRSPLNTRNRVVNSFTNQIGHRGLDVIWTGKSAGWLDRQGLGFETDVEVECQDLAKTRWGRKNHVTKGKLVHLTAWDRSGALTGRRADPRDRHARPFAKWMDSTAWIYWTAYDTRFLMSIEDMFAGVKLDLQKTVISNRQRLDEALINSVHDLVNQFRESSETMQVQCDRLRAAADIAGLNLNDKILGQALKQLGVKHRRKSGGNVYDISDMKDPVA